jgi:MFS family permease
VATGRSGAHVCPVLCDSCALVGAFADALPKGRVMLYSNGIKIAGCLMMLFGTHPLMSYAIVGLGAAAYSPAKYGILTELLPASQLVKANGWIEGLTIASIILGVLLGGQLVGPVASAYLLSFDMPLITTSIDTAPEAAIGMLIFVYIIAACVQHPHSLDRCAHAALAQATGHLAARLLDLQYAPVA